MHAATRLDPFRRLVVEMLARTGMRVGELCALQADAVCTVGETQWLRVPVGKLHTDRYIPLHPILLELLDQWRTWAGPNDSGLLITNRGRPLDRSCIARAVARCARVVYARIADRTVADQYFAATDQVEALYTNPLTTSPASGPK